MLRNVTKVEKQGEGALLLHQEKGQPHKLVRTLTMFGFIGSDVRLWTRSYYTSTARSPDGQDLGGLIATAEYLRGEGPNPVFDVASVNTGTDITFEATCSDAFYGFEGNTFVDELKKIQVRIVSGSSNCAVLNVITDWERDPGKDGDARLLYMSVVVAKDEFLALFRHLWMSPTPPIIRVSVSIPCFQRKTAGLAPGFPEDAVLEGDRAITAQLNDILIEKRLISPKTDETLNQISEQDQDQPSTLNAIQAHAAQIAKSLQRIQVIVATATGFLIAMVLLGR